MAAVKAEPLYVDADRPTRHRPGPIRRRRLRPGTAEREGAVPGPDDRRVWEDAAQREQLRRCLGRLSRPPREAIMLAF